MRASRRRDSSGTRTCYGCVSLAYLGQQTAPAPVLVLGRFGFSFRYGIGRTRPFKCAWLTVRAYILCQKMAKSLHTVKGGASWLQVSQHFALSNLGLVAAGLELMDLQPQQENGVPR